METYTKKQIVEMAIKNQEKLEKEIKEHLEVFKEVLGEDGKHSFWMYESGVNHVLACNRINNTIMETLLEIDCDV